MKKSRDIDIVNNWWERAWLGRIRRFFLFSTPLHSTTSQTNRWRLPSWRKRTKKLSRRFEQLHSSSQVILKWFCFTGIWSCWNHLQKIHQPEIWLESCDKSCVWTIIWIVSVERKYLSEILKKYENEKYGSNLMLNVTCAIKITLMYLFHKAVSNVVK